MESITLKTIVFSLLSALLGAFAIYNIGGLVVEVISGIETPLNIYRIIFILLVISGAYYLFQLSKKSLHENPSLKKIIIFAIPVSAILLAGVFIFLTAFYIDKTKKLPQYDESYLEHQASLINEQLPLMIDDGLEAFSIEADGLSLVNHYRFVNYQDSELDPVAVEKTLKNIAVANSCNNKHVNSLLLNDISVIYKVYGKEKNLIADIVVTKQVCQ